MIPERLKTEVTNVEYRRERGDMIEGDMIELYVYKLLIGKFYSLCRPMPGLLWNSLLHSVVAAESMYV